MKRSHFRLLLILIMLTCISFGISLILNNLNDNIVFFHLPSELLQLPESLEQKTRVGGLVKAGSIRKIAADNISFIIKDDSAEITILYQGILPALFREGQGIVAEGKLNADKRFIAARLLVKHDENYKPPQANIKQQP